MTPSAVPQWILQLLPPWFLKRPALTEALWAFWISSRNSTFIIFAVLYGAAASSGAGDTLQNFIAWLGAHWFGVLMGYIFSGGFATSRAKTAADRVNAAETAPPTKGT